MRALCAYVALVCDCRAANDTKKKYTSISSWCNEVAFLLSFLTPSSPRSSSASGIDTDCWSSGGGVSSSTTNTTTTKTLLLAPVLPARRMAAAKGGACCFPGCGCCTPSRSWSAWTISSHPRSATSTSPGRCLPPSASTCPGRGWGRSSSRQRWVLDRCVSVHAWKRCRMRFVSTTANKVVVRTSSSPSQSTCWRAVRRSGTADGRTGPYGELYSVRRCFGLLFGVSLTLCLLVRTNMFRDHQRDRICPVGVSLGLTCHRCCRVHPRRDSKLCQAVAMGA